MSWRDFFYFSKGERMGLIVLLCLITIAGILLILNNNAETVKKAEIQQISTGNIVETANKTPETQPANAQVGTNNTSSAGNSPVNKAPVSVNASSQNPTKQNESSAGADNPNATGANAGSNSANNRESVSERVNRLTSYSHPSYTRVEKFEKGTVVELNTADTTILKKVPGIGSAFAKRIVGYRELLGGYYSVTQLSEVYGIDEERYNEFIPWFSADPSFISMIAVNNISQDSLRRHPYIDYGQARIIIQLRKQKGKLTGWENLQLLNEFTDLDMIRLKYYLSFE